MEIISKYLTMERWMYAKHLGYEKMMRKIHEKKRVVVFSSAAAAAAGGGGGGGGGAGAAGAAGVGALLVIDAALSLLVNHQY